jgi:iron complex outermembrane receptor protein
MYIDNIASARHFTGVDVNTTGSALGFNGAPVDGMRTLGCALGASLLCGALPAAADIEAPDQLEFVVVTAERREMSSEDVALSMTALSGAALERSVLQSTIELQQRVPGLVVTTNATDGQPYIRGVGSDIINIGTDSSVAVYMDGVYQARASAAIQDFFDLERVEILKGPQGTLYGRNAAGGAINLLSRDPDYRFGGYVKGLLGNYDQRRSEAAANIPLIDQRLALRAALLYDEREGYTKDLYHGTTIDDAGLHAGRLKLRFNPRPDLDLLVAYEGSRERSTRNLAPKLDTSLPSPAVTFGAVPPVGPRLVSYDRPNSERKDQNLLFARARWSLGAGILTSLTAYNETGFDLDLDSDATAIDLLRSLAREASRTFSQELTLASAPGAAAQWVTGVYYLRERANQDLKLPFDFPFPGLTPPYPTASIEYPVGSATDAYEMYAQGSYPLTPRLQLTGGFRYLRERRLGLFHEIVADPLGVLTHAPGGSSLDVHARGQRTWDAWMPRLEIEYRPAQHSLLYCAVARGYKSGGFNLLGTGEQFQPESVWNFELGIKSTQLNRRIRFESAVFHYRYTDLQVNRFEPRTGGVSATVTNAAAARIDGIEGHLVTAITPRLQVDLAVAALDARFTRYLTTNPDAVNPFVLKDLSGNTLPRAPRAAASAGLETTLALGAVGTVTLRGEGRYQSRVWFDQFNARHVDQGGYTLLNVFATVRDARDHWRCALYARNLTDRLYKQSVLHGTALFGTLDFFGAPRTYGVELGYQL